MTSSSGTVPTHARSAVFWSSLNGVAAVGLPFAVFTCFARLMTPDQFALVGLALAALEMLKTLAPQGLYDVLVTHDERERAYHEAAAAILLGSAAVIMAAFVGLLAVSQAVFGMHMPGIVYGLAAKVLFDLALLQPQAAMVRRGEIRRLSTRSLYSGLIGALCGLPLGMVASPMGGLVAFYVVQSLVTFLATVWGADILVAPRYHRAAAQDMLGQGLRASGVRIAAGGNNYLDQLLVGRMFLPRMVGDFNLGKRIEIVSVTIASSMAQILWQPRFATSGVDDRRGVMARGVASVALVCGVPVVLFCMLAQVAVPFVFGQHWASAAPVVAVLAASGAVRALGSVAGTVLTVTQRNGLLLRISLGGLIANIAIILIGAPYGLFITAIGILVRSVALSFSQYVMVREMRRDMAWVVLDNFLVPLALVAVACLTGRLVAAQLLAGLSGPLHDGLYLALSCSAGLAAGIALLFRKL